MRLGSLLRISVPSGDHSPGDLACKPLADLFDMQNEIVAPGTDSERVTTSSIRINQALGLGLVERLGVVTSSAAW